MVSIIVPNYNHARFIEQRLDSIFHQSYQDFEVILLDDASTDKSVEILKKYAGHPKVSHFIINKKNSGSPFRQWKKGIELAQGEFIWIAESDDYNSKNFLAESMKHLKKDETGLVFNKTIIVDEDENELEEMTPLNNGEYKGADLLKTSFSRGNLIFNGSSVVFKKKLVLKKLKNLTNFQICGDWFLWSSIATKEHIEFTESSVTFYRKHNHATTNQLFENTTFFIEAFSILSFFKKNMKLTEDTFRLWLYRINSNQEKLDKKKLVRILIKLFGLKGYFYYLKVKLST